MHFKIVSRMLLGSLSKGVLGLRILSTFRGQVGRGVQPYTQIVEDPLSRSTDQEDQNTHPPNRVDKASNLHQERIECMLGIETSCDDTCVSVITRSDILSDVRTSQFELHSQYGGIQPMVARRAHEKNLPLLVSQAVNQYKGRIQAVSVSVGPGLKLCLKVGLEVAKKVATQLDLPLVPVNHLEAHVLVTRRFNPSPAFPFVVLLVSGGHCMLSLCKGVGQYELLGTTLDDSVGEAFDKVGRLLGLSMEAG